MVMVFLLLSAGEVNQDVPLWKKLSYSIGYSGGLCWRGKDLMPYCPYMFCWEWPFYHLHSIELSAIYPFGNGEGIEVGVGYGWARIEDARGWGISVEPSDTGYLYGYLGGGHSWNIKRYCLILEKVRCCSFINVGIGISYSNAITHEGLYYYKLTSGGGEWILMEEAMVTRHCLGGSIKGMIEYPVIKSKDISLSLSAIAKFSMDWEVYNNSPFKWTGKEKKIWLHFSGVYIKIKILIGGE